MHKGNDADSRRLFGDACMHFGLLYYYYYYCYDYYQPQRTP